MAGEIFSYPGISEDIKKVDSQIKASNKKFRSLKKELKKITAQMNQLGRKKKITDRKIKNIADSLASLTKKIKSLSHTYSEHRKNLKKLKKELSEAAKKQNLSENFCRRNAETLYEIEASRRNFPEKLLYDPAGAAGEDLEIHSISSVIENASDFSRETSEKMKQIEKKAEEVGQKAENLKKMLNQISNQIGKYARVKRKYEKEMRAIKKRQEKLKKEIAQKKENMKKLDKMIEKFMQRKKNLLIEKQKEKEFLSKKGKLPKPVEGTVVVFFGKSRHPKLPTYVINRGIKIKASTSTVIAVKKGVVSFAGVFKGYGKTVIIDHGGGFYTVTANLDRIDVDEGEIVKSKTEIGKIAVGKTVYFEVRKNGIPDNPLRWLEKK
ncbi:MAG: peptidoglycan DD-metalloendopeptidase family protein [Elusimicrobia bacterium]|nr:peptidoglycan DD-metalloendopeptidase family protein [Elusimicrobiota bacterium]